MIKLTQREGRLIAALSEAPNGFMEFGALSVALDGLLPRTTVEHKQVSGRFRQLARRLNARSGHPRVQVVRGKGLQLLGPVTQPRPAAPLALGQAQALADAAEQGRLKERDQLRAQTPRLLEQTRRGPDGQRRQWMLAALPALNTMELGHVLPFLRELAEQAAPEQRDRLSLYAARYLRRSGASEAAAALSALRGASISVAVQARFGLGHIHLRSGAFNAAEQLFQEALRQASGELDWLRGRAYSNLSLCRWRSGERKQALADNEAAIAIALRHRDELTVLRAKENRAVWRMRMGQVEAARRELRVLLENNRSYGYLRDEVISLTNLGSAALSAGLLEEAEDLLTVRPQGEAARSTQRQAATTQMNLGILRALQGRLPEARTSLTGALAAQRSQGGPDQALTELNLALLHALEADLAGGLEVLDAIQTRGILEHWREALIRLLLALKTPGQGAGPDLHPDLPAWLRQQVKRAETLTRSALREALRRDRPKPAAERFVRKAMARQIFVG